MFRLVDVAGMGLRNPGHTPRFSRRRGAAARTSRSGGALVEMVLGMSLLLSLSFGLVEFGYCFYCKNQLVGAAREGARTAIVPGSSSSDVTTAVANALASTHWPSSNYTVAITNTSGGSLNLSTVSAGSQVEVTVSGVWSVLGSGMSPLKLIGGTKVISGVCVMRKES